MEDNSVMERRLGKHELKSLVGRWYHRDIRCRNERCRAQIARTQQTDPVTKVGYYYLHEFNARVTGTSAK